MDFEELLEFEFAPLEKMALTHTELAEAIKDVDPSPSEAQKKSGVYRKGHLAWKGLGLTIETAKGQYRRGTSEDGKAWSTLMKDSYGYINKSLSEADGDHLDIFLCEDDLNSEIVFVVNQMDPATDRFNEHKIIIGVTSEDRAREVYLRNYEDGWQGLGSVKAMTLADFKAWIADGDTAKHAAVPLVVVVKRASDKEDRLFTIAVDLDGTLAVHDGPFDANKIGDVKASVREWVKKFHTAGAVICIWTTRGDTAKIRTWLKDNDVPFDHVNENPNQPPGTSSKIIADAYIDDRAINVSDLDEAGHGLLARIGGDEQQEEPGVRVEVTHTRYVVPADILLELLND